ncbi:ribosomal-protein-alanine N-acetyltransferase [Meridianimarinicoccus roseus]|jgi:ribosomal-protein-alanine N-acetyltransferase|uniref:[Ribosomal protein bS18]-alanine N-acetyltransferase n=1 Tax=Meridianimarinicoccus roseus TaxID=2072018 RepID=A0A2V2LDH0_9RHOB|nr:ribosomal protein S18-alanine N-acetyltransferase [Meridianimarinicoccus roseus]PWR01346.1 ribosomal-protein-alanine N-acetyltransferase [Meridianimarinicoccus roseus]
MTPDEMAALHRLGFTVPRPWTAGEFAALLDQPGTVLLTAPSGFALCRIIAGEAELLTITVAPSARRAGTGRELMDRVLEAARRAGAESCFLEVAADNAPALALYAACGFRPVGRRRAYYRAPDGRCADAMVMAHDMTGPEQNA